MFPNQNSQPETQDSGSGEEGNTGIAVKSPVISLPKGGGALKSIGEKFAANPVTGTGSLIVPIATSPGRSGFGPQLSLSYDSGTGNGPFGLGWQLSIPSITRKTDKGLPKYQDVDESDVFILSGAEDLVPQLVEEDGQWRRHGESRTVDGIQYLIQRYRPRIEGLFARIERWSNLQTGEIHWRSISRENITTLYGKTAENRIADPEDPTRIFSWLICQSYDDKGNAIVYEYIAENSDNVDASQAHEKNRTSLGRSAKRYVKRIKYGNRSPNRDVNWLATDPTLLSDWMFEVVFDYGEGHFRELPLDASIPQETQHRFVEARLTGSTTWPVRQDPFSAYRAGFEVRTYRLCRRVMMFHHFPDELDTDDYLVSATHFTYEEGPIATFITSVSQSGYKRQENRTYLQKSLPPLEFKYSQAVISDEIRDVDPESLENLPIGLDGSLYRWVDLDGEGLSGLLTEQADAWFYKPNNGNGRFGPLELVAERPALAALNGGWQQLLDLAGDGQLDLVQLNSPTAGFYERTQDERWASFRRFTSLPNIDWNDPNLRFVDLSGDGHADILITQDNVFTRHLSLAEAGYGPSEQQRQVFDEEQGPRLVFADGTQSIYLADLSGDNLVDLARIRNGEICYWPNLGYGRFGAKVTMDHAPHLDAPDLFDQRRVRLADIDGSGTTDIIYLGQDTIEIYRNCAGNSWQDPEQLDHFPDTNDLTSVTVVDLLGNGTACLVWSSMLPGDGHQSMRYIDLMGGQKPHLMIATRNNLGTETVVRYTPSTKFYLADKQAGRPWLTRLPFPVHIVEQVETYDHISQNRFVTRYAYHHGYFDGTEREFRGFGMVEQIDTEEFAVLGQREHFPSADNIDQASHVPPVLTKTWFHTGAYREGGRISRQFEKEYFQEPGDSPEEFAAQLLPDTVLPPDLTPGETREAARALKGTTLRQEVYALDGTDREQLPYTISESSQKLKLIQPRGENQHAVFYVCACNTLASHYERNLNDPRVTHDISLEVDEFGNVLRAASIGYGRRQADPTLDLEDQAKQMQLLVTYMENSFTVPVDLPDDYRTPLPFESRTFEVTGLELDAGSHFDLTTIDDAVLVAVEIPYESQPDGSLQKRLIEHVRTIYRRNDLNGLLPPGQLESLALPGESYQLAFTPGLMSIYRRGGQSLLPANLADLLAGGGPDQGGYVDLGGDGQLWIPSGRVFLSPNSSDSPAQELSHAREHFFLPHRFHDPFGATSLVSYDNHNLLMLETEDPLENKVTTGERDEQGNITNRNDYRVLHPQLVTDPNCNRTEVAFDALGMVAGTAVMGKLPPSPVPVVGDSLQGFEPDLTQAQIDNFFTAADPHIPARPLLNGATTRIVYDLERYWRTKQIHSGDTARRLPVWTATLARETHLSDPLPPGGLIVQTSFSYSDGFGREIQQKIQAEPGPGPRRDAGGQIIVGPDGQPEMTTDDVNPRWVGSGWTIFNNKGLPVRQFEPFFTNTHDFEFDVRIGVSPILFYDSLERVIATLHPNHTWEKVVFDTWQQQNWDVNDTVLVAAPNTDPDIGDYFRRLPDEAYLPSWHSQRVTGDLGTAEQDAAAKAAAHAGTPAEVYLDSMGRPFLAVADNGPGGKFKTRIDLDIEGNQRAVIDARGRTVMRYDYDMLGNQVRQDSMEAGTRWGLANAAGNLIYGWDSRDHRLRTTYDEIQRPAGLFLQVAGGAELLVELTIYGEGQGEDTNHRGQVFQQFDGAGVVTSEEYDYKGNLLRSTRQLVQDYKTTLDWQTNPVLESENIFSISTEYDALNRPIVFATPDESLTRPTYNEANLLERLDVNLHGAAAPTNFVVDIDYNARGQRTAIEYGNGVTTTYDYDDQTFRLTNLKTTRTNDGDLQNLRYAYDPAGNITSIRDEAQQTIFFNNSVVEPHTGYTYDAVYRLIGATGREHIGQAGAPQTTWKDTPRFVTGIPNPNQPQAMRRYRQEYKYDEAGNFLRLVHTAHNGNWNRSYHYEEPSELDPLQQSNRLTRTEVGNVVEPYFHDDHGNMTQMPHLPLMQWDYSDRLRTTTNQVVNNGGMPVITYYIYNASGQRVRKVTERQNSTRQKERFYLDGFEIYREYDGDGNMVALERETLHVMADLQRVALVETKTFESGLLPRLGSLFRSPTPLVRFQIGNHLGSTSLELDDLSRVISFEEYYPYGSTSYQATGSNIETAKRYRFTSMERDEESGLNYHFERYYLTWLGRWLNTDPIGLEGGANLYDYSRNNPIKYIDQEGTQPSTPVQNVEEFLPGTLADYPHLGQMWDKNAEAVLERQYKQGSVEANKRKFFAEIDKYKGSKRTKFTRRVFNKVRTGFYKDVGKQYKQGKKVLGGIDLPDSVVDKMIEKGTVPRKGVQIDHAIQELAEHPHKALDPTNLGIKSGHATVPGGSHHAATNARKKHRANKAGKNQGGRLAVVVAAPTVFKQLASEDYAGAAETTGTTAAYFTPAAPLAFAKDTIKAYDDEVVEMANDAGTWVEDKTGFVFLGALTAAAVSTLVSTKRAVIGKGGGWGSFGEPHPDFHFIKETDNRVEVGPGNSSMIPRSRYPGKTIRYH